MTELSPISRPYIYVLVLAAISAILYIILSRVGGGPIWLKPLIGGLATATAASYITSALVNRSFREQEAHHQTRMRNTAYRSLKKPLQRHIRILIEMYIATSEGVPEKCPADYQKLFNDNFEEQVRYLKTSKKYPIIKENITWGVYIREQIEIFQENIDKTLSLYSAWLDAEEVETLQNLRDSSFSSMLVRTSYVDLSGSSEPILMSMSDEVSAHIELLLQVIEKYENSDELDIRDVEDFNVWSETVAPSFGCGSSKTEVVHPSDGQWVQLHRNDVGTRKRIGRDALDTIYGN